MSWLPSGHKAILRSGLWIVLLILVRICLMYLIVKLLMLCTTKCFKSLWRTHNGSLKTRGDKSSFPARRITCFNRDIDWRQLWVKTLPMIYFPGNFLLLSGYCPYDYNFCYNNTSFPLCKTWHTGEMSFPVNEGPSILG